MVFVVCFCFIIFCLNVNSQRVTTPKILNVNERWFDDFMTDFKRGIGGWCLSSDYAGINTTNEYHGFYDDNSDILFRQFMFNYEGTCDISFNLVFGCKATIDDSLIFEVGNDYGINNHSEMLYYSEEYPFTFLNDIRIYYGGNELNSDPQCQTETPIYGGYEIYYEYSYNITNNIKDVPFKISFIPNFVNDSIINRYYGVYNISILCTIEEIEEILYSETLFLSLNVFTRYLILWIIAGLALLIACIFIVYMSNQRSKPTYVKLKGDQKRKPYIKNGRTRNAKSIIIKPTSAIDVFMQLKTISKSKKNSEHSVPLLSDQDDM